VIASSIIYADHGKQFRLLIVDRNTKVLMADPPPDRYRSIVLSETLQSVDRSSPSKAMPWSRCTELGFGVLSAVSEMARKVAFTGTNGAWLSPPTSGDKAMVRHDYVRKPSLVARSKETTTMTVSFKLGENSHCWSACSP
jgi:hypothetical protein